MCVNLMGGGGPSVPAESEAAKQQREAEMEAEKKKAAEAKAERLEQTVAAVRKGPGRRSLITGTRGGIGYFRETM